MSRPHRRFQLAVMSHEGTYSVLFGSWPIPVGSGHRTGYLARPDTAGRFPVVVVVPGLSGMGSFEKDLCRRLARQGIAALSIDLYRGDEDPLLAYAGLTDLRALIDLDELHEFIVSDDVDWNVSGDIGVIGTDVGGRFALIKAATRDWVKAAIVAYTPLTGDEDREFQVADYLEHLPIPFLGLYGSQDELIDTGSVDEAQRRNTHGQWLLYEGAGHGFLDVTAEGFEPGAADDAMARIVAFFTATLDAPVLEDLG
ncbi:MAG: dienelactone hydrolase family protein [Actinomycetota bacterium]|nr:dienelactone hydrolase family protein [Actinomycetota bacterium]